MKALQVFIAAIIGLVAALSACTGPMHTHRYRLTIKVETPDGIKSGSSVIEGRAAKIRSIDQSGLGAGVRGEAVFVDLGRGKHVVRDGQAPLDPLRA